MTAVAVDVYNQTITGDVACAVTAAVGGGKYKWSENTHVLSKLGGVRHGCLRQESWQGSVNSMGEVRDAWCQPRSDVICLEGNGYRPSHKGDGWTVGGAMYTLNSTEVHAVCYAIDHVVTGGATVRLKGNAGMKKFAPL